MIKYPRLNNRRSKDINASISDVVIIRAETRDGIIYAKASYLFETDEWQVDGFGGSKIYGIDVLEWWNIPAPNSGNSLKNKAEHLIDSLITPKKKPLIDTLRNEREQKLALSIVSKRVAVDVLRHCYGEDGFDYPMIDAVGKVINDSLDKRLKKG